MKTDEKIRLFNSVFAPKSGEKVLFLVDTPHDNIKDTKEWNDRRKTAEQYFLILVIWGRKNNFLLAGWSFLQLVYIISLFQKNILKLPLRWIGNCNNRIFNIIITSKNYTFKEF